MKLYAIKDKLIDYFQQPWAAPGDKEVLTAVASAINNQENHSAIGQAPHHFEVWKIGEVDDQGTITPSKEFLADCSSLVRRSIRPEGRNDERAPATETGNGPAGAPRGARGADERPNEGTLRPNA